MAELSVEEITRLAHRFLSGSADASVLNQMKQAINEDPQVALELLTQMQEALEESAPFGFTPEQWTEVDKRVQGLFSSSGKRRSKGLFGFIKGLFASKPKAAAEEKDDISEESPVEDAPVRVKGRGASSPAAAPSVMDDDEAPVSDSAALSQVIDETVDQEKTSKRKKTQVPVKLIVSILLIIAFIIGLWFLGSAISDSVGSLKDKLFAPEPTPTMVPTPKPAGTATPTATVTLTPGPYIPRRAIPMIKDEELPAYFGASQPVNADKNGYVEPADTIDPVTGERLPLPSQ